MSSRGESKSVRTSTRQEGNKVTTVTETTITYPDGRTQTTREESTTTKGGNGGSSDLSSDDMRKKFNDMHIPGGASRDSKSSDSAASSKGSPSDKGKVSDKDFTKQSLVAHNERRKKHGVPNLKLSQDLIDYAQKWADHLVKTNTFQHSSCQLGDTRLGENIANKWSSQGADYTGEEATEQWYSEISKYDYNQEMNSGTGHFTQVVWKGSEELGIAKATASDGKVIVVGSYRPAGNMIGSFKQNVFPPK